MAKLQFQRTTLLSQNTETGAILLRFQGSPNEFVWIERDAAYNGEPWSWWNERIVEGQTEMDLFIDWNGPAEWPTNALKPMPGR